MLVRKAAETLVCIPCFNCEHTIGEVLHQLLADSDADVLLIDDASDQPLEAHVKTLNLDGADRVTVFRPEQKQYAGGGKNIGIRVAAEMGYRRLICLDSDIVIQHGFSKSLQVYLDENPEQVVVGAAILPFGEGCQYADTLINFSTYLPDPFKTVSEKDCLASYAFALNMDLFRKQVCYMPRQIGGEDVYFFRKIREQFGLEKLPLLNKVAVFHKHPRTNKNNAFATQRRYAKGFFAYNDESRVGLFNRIPWLHLLTPRFCLMVLRLAKRKRLHDLLMAPLCWRLDFVRSLEIMKLTRDQYRFDFDAVSTTTA